MCLSLLIGGKNRKINTAQATVHNDNPLHKLFSLIQFHIFDRYEIYTVAQSLNSYEQLRTIEETKDKLPSIDLKK